MKHFLSEIEEEGLPMKTGFAFAGAAAFIAQEAALAKALMEGKALGRKVRPTWWRERVPEL